MPEMRGMKYVLESLRAISTVSALPCASASGSGRSTTPETAQSHQSRINGVYCYERRVREPDSHRRRALYGATQCWVVSLGMKMVLRMYNILSGLSSLQT